MSCPETNDGVHLAITEDGKDFRLPLAYFGLHFAFYGVTGSGKTRAAMNLAIKSENEGLHLRIIDVEGEWKNIIPSLKKETVYYDVSKNLKVNPFDLQDYGLTELLLKETIFKGMESEYNDLSPQMNFMLDKCVLISKSIPKLIENVITHKPNIEFPLRNIDLTRAALLTRLNPYRDNPVLRNIFYVSKSSIDMSSIRDKNLIIDLHSLDMKVAYKRELRLIYNTLATAYLREALNTEADQTKNMFFADEAQLLVPKILQKAVVTDTWATTDFATRLRKRGESLVIISQSPANIEDDIRKNSQNLFIFRLLDPLDTKTVAGMFGYVQIDEVNHLSTILANMDTRSALTKTPSITCPILVKTLDVELPKMTAEELEKCSPKSEEAVQEPLSEDEQELLQNINKKPFLNNTERALSLGWHRTRYSETRKILKVRELVEEISFKTKFIGAPSRFLKMKGRIDYGKGEFIHAFWMDKIFNYLTEQRCKPEKEYHVKGKIVDMAYRGKDGKTVFVEIEYKSDWKGNILRAAKLCDRLVSVFVRERDMVEAMNFVKQEKLSNVTVTDAYYAYIVMP